MILFLTGFISQILFAIFRTINVQHVAKDNLGGSVWSGTVVAILWVVTTHIGLTAFEDTLWGFFGYLTGASSGIALAMRHKQIRLWLNRILRRNLDMTYRYENHVHTFSYGRDHISFNADMWSYELASAEAAKRLRFSLKFTHFFN